MTGSNSTGIGIIRALSSPSLPLPTDVTPLLRPLTKVRAVVFDVYGTMFTSFSGDVGTLRDSAPGDPFAEALSGSGFVPDLDTAARSRIGNAARTVYFETISEHHERLRREGADFPEVDIREVWTDTIGALMRSKILRPVDSSPPCIETLSVEAECRRNPVWPMPHLVWVREY